MVHFDLKVHLREDVFTAKNLETIGYKVWDIVSDCYEVALNSTDIASGKSVEIFGLNPESSEDFLLECDDDLERLFKVYEGKNEVHVKVNIHSSNTSQTSQISNTYNLEADHNLTILNDEECHFTDDDDENGVVGASTISVEGTNLVQEGYESSDNWSGAESSDDEPNFFDSDDSDAGQPMTKIARQVKGNEFFRSKDGDVEFHVGQVFQDMNHLRKILKDYSIQEGFDPVKLKNEQVRLTFKCGQKDDCPWRIHATPMADKITVMIRTYCADHTCQRNNSNVKEATSVWIAEKLEKVLMRNPNMSIKDMTAELKDTYKIECNHHRLIRARNKVRKKFSGDYGASFAMLPRYAAALKQYNPGVMVKLGFETRTLNEVTNKLSQRIFKRFFISFPAIRNNYLKGCKPFIGVDGCHLKGPFKGILLSAVALDANSGVMPIAVMVCEGETYETWCYFLDLIDTYFGRGVEGQSMPKITFMSDRQKGLIEAVKSVFGDNADHRYCARHIFMNFIGKFPGPKCKNLFWKAVRSPNEVDFKNIMSEMKNTSVEAYQWLMKIPTKHWSVHMYDERLKSDVTNNNMTECFNSWLGTHREEPIMSMLEAVRNKVMMRVNKRKELAVNCSKGVTPRVWKKIEKAAKDSRNVTLIVGDRLEYEARINGKAYVVNLNYKTCSCRAWAISGIPCLHAMSAILYERFIPETFCHFSHTKDAYVLAYSENISPMPDQSVWPVAAVIPNERDEDPMLPPIIRKHAGRPKKARKRDPNEQNISCRNQRSSTVHCKTCGTVGHNQRTCPQSKKSNN